MHLLHRHRFTPYLASLIIIAQLCPPFTIIKADKALPLQDFKPVLAVLELYSEDLPESDAELLTELFRLKLDNAGLFQVLTTDEVSYLLEGIPYPVEINFLIEQAAKELVAGKTLYDHLEFDEAVEKLSHAVAILEKALIHLSDNVNLSEARLFLAMTYLAKGMEEEAEAQFLEIARMNPEKKLDPRYFSPKVIKAFEETKQRLSIAPKGVIVLTSDPPFANIYLNGVFRGITPSTFEEVPIGNHWIRIEKEGFEDWFQQIDLHAGRMISLKTNLVQETTHNVKGHGYRLKEGEEFQVDLQHLIEIGEYLDVDHLVVGSLQNSWSKILLKVHWIDVTEKAVIKSQSAKFDLTAETYTDIIGTLALNTIPEYLRTDRSFAFASNAIPLDANPSNILWEQAKSVTEEIDLLGEGDFLSKESSLEREKAWYQKWWWWVVLAGVIGGAYAGAELNDNDNDRASTGNTGEVLIQFPSP